MLYFSGTAMIYSTVVSVIVDSKGAKVIYVVGAIMPALLTMMIYLKYCIDKVDLLKRLALFLYPSTPEVVI